MNRPINKGILNRLEAALKEGKSETIKKEILRFKTAIKLPFYWITYSGTYEVDLDGIMTKVPVKKDDSIIVLMSSYIYEDKKE